MKITIENDSDVTKVVSVTTMLDGEASITGDVQMSLRREGKLIQMPPGFKCTIDGNLMSVNAYNSWEDIEALAGL